MAMLCLCARGTCMCSRDLEVNIQVVYNNGLVEVNKGNLLAADHSECTQGTDPDLGAQWYARVKRVCKFSATPRNCRDCLVSDCFLAASCSKF